MESGTPPEPSSNPYATPEFGADTVPPDPHRKVRTFIIVAVCMWGGAMVGGTLGLWRLAWRWPDDLTRSALLYYAGCGALLGLLVGSFISAQLIVNYRSASLREIRFRRSELLGEIRDRAAREGTRQTPRDRQ